MDVNAVAKSVDLELLREAFPNATGFQQVPVDAPNDYRICKAPPIKWERLLPGQNLERSISVTWDIVTLKPLELEPGLFAGEHEGVVYFKLTKRLAPFYSKPS